MNIEAQLADHCVEAATRLVRGSVRAGEALMREFVREEEENG